jgi:hypothetical protein
MGSLPDNFCGLTEEEMGIGLVTASSMKDISVKRVAYAYSVYFTAEKVGRKGHIAKQSNSLRPDMAHHVNSYLKTGVGTIQKQPLDSSDPDDQRVPIRGAVLH